MTNLHSNAGLRCARTPKEGSCETLSAAGGLRPWRIVCSDAHRADQRLRGEDVKDASRMRRGHDESSCSSRPRGSPLSPSPVVRSSCPGWSYLIYLFGSSWCARRAWLFRSSWFARRALTFGSSWCVRRAFAFGSSWFARRVFACESSWFARRALAFALQVLQHDGHKNGADFSTAD
jgi:hypothetical protein